MSRFRVIVPIVLAMAMAAIVTAPAAEKPGGAQTPPGALLEGTGSGPQTFTLGGLEMRCEEADFRGSVAGASKSLSLEPVYGGCVTKALDGLPDKFVLNECFFVMKMRGSHRKGDRPRPAAVSLKCRPGYTMEWHVYETRGRFNAGLALCTTDIPSQAHLGTAWLGDSGADPGRISIRWRLRQIEYRTFGSALLCGSPFGATDRDGRYDGAATIASSGRGRQAIEPGLGQ